MSVGLLKKFVNSTIGTAAARPLDDMINAVGFPWQYLIVDVATKNVEIPHSGKFRIYAFGDSANQPGGGSCVDERTYQKGDILACTLNASFTTVTCSARSLSMTANASTASNPGTATGGNIDNAVGGTIGGAGGIGGAGAAGTPGAPGTSGGAGGIGIYIGGRGGVGGTGSNSSTAGGAGGAGGVGGNGMYVGGAGGAGGSGGYGYDGAYGGAGGTGGVGGAGIICGGSGGNGGSGGAADYGNRYGITGNGGNGGAGGSVGGKGGTGAITGTGGSAGDPLFGQSYATATDQNGAIVPLWIPRKYIPLPTNTTRFIWILEV